MKQFFATEAAFRAVLLLFNLLAEFQRAAGLPLYREPATFRTQILTRGAILGRAGRKVDQFPNGLFAAAMMLWIKRMVVGIYWTVPGNPKWNPDRSTLILKRKPTEG